MAVQNVKQRFVYITDFTASLSKNTAFRRGNGNPHLL